MDGGLSRPDIGDGEDKDAHVPFYKTFEKLCPYYMSIGMTYEQFWDGEAELPKYFREAHELRMREQNRMMYYQGAYVYSAIIAVSPILRAFSKAKEPAPYLDDVIPISEKEADEIKERKEREQFEKNLTWMKTISQRLNEQFKEKSNAGFTEP